MDDANGPHRTTWVRRRSSLPRLVSLNLAKDHRYMVGLGNSVAFDRLLDSINVIIYKVS